METKSCLHTTLHSAAAGGGLMLLMCNAPNMLSSKCKTRKKVTFKSTPSNPTGAFSRETQCYLPHLTHWHPAETGMNFLLFKKAWADLEAKGSSLTHRWGKAEGEHPPPDPWGWELSWQCVPVLSSFKDGTEIQPPRPLSPKLRARLRYKASNLPALRSLLRPQVSPSHDKSINTILILPPPSFRWISPYPTPPRAVSNLGNLANQTFPNIWPKAAGPSSSESLEQASSLFLEHLLLWSANHTYPGFYTYLLYKDPFSCFIICGGGVFFW